jgi:hypothetical protein
MLRHIAFVIIGLLLVGGVSAQDTLSIHQIQEVPPGGDISPYNGQNIVTGGVVTVGTGIFYIGTGATVYMEDATGGIFSGINVYSPDGTGFPSLVTGDSIICQGTVMDAGMTRLVISSGQVDIRQPAASLEPLIINASEIDSTVNSDSLAEKYESIFVRVPNLIVDSTRAYNNTSFWYCHDTTGNCIIQEASDSIPNSFIPPVGTQFVFIQGVINQISGYYILRPRCLMDLRLESYVCIGDVFHLPPQPTSLDTINIIAEVGDGVTNVTLLYSASGDWATIPMNNINDSCRATIGPFPAYTIVDYFIRARDNQLNTCYSPWEAPDSYYSFMVVGPLLCPYIAGDVNDNGAVNGLDVIYLVNYFKGGAAPPLSCDNGNGPIFVEADINGNCVVNAADITYLVNFFLGRNTIDYCPTFPPGGRIK